MKKLAILAALASLCGCFSVIRIPFPAERQGYTTPEGEEVWTNTVYKTCPNYPMCIYPTIHLRYHLFAFAWQSAPEGFQWRHVGGPIAGIVSLIGLPGDFLVDTIALPWDWNASETNKCPMCRGIGTWNDPVPEDAPVDGCVIRINGTRVK